MKEVAIPRDQNGKVYLMCFQSDTGKGSLTGGTEKVADCAVLDPGNYHKLAELGNDKYCVMKSERRVLGVARHSVGASA